MRQHPDIPLIGEWCTICKSYEEHRNGYLTGTGYWNGKSVTQCLRCAHAVRY